MARPLKGMHSIRLSSQELIPGDKVTVYGYPAGKLAKIPAAFYGETKDGMLVFETKHNDGNLIPGISGALVMNEKNEAVGLVNVGQNSFIGAVPVWSLAEFIKKVQPARYSQILSYPGLNGTFRPREPGLAQPNLVAESQVLVEDAHTDKGMSPPPALPEEYLWFDLDRPIPALSPVRVGSHFRVDEPPNIQALRKSAEDLLDRVNDLIAVGNQRSTGGTAPEETMQYLLRMVSERQTFTMDGKDLHELPCPKYAIGIGTEWSEMPTMVGSNLKLRIEQVDDLTLGGWGQVKVFRYGGTAEDKVSSIRYCNGHFEKIVWVPVRVEVWTDSDLNILRITQELLAPPSMSWINMRFSVLYGWLAPSVAQRELVPTNIMSRAQSTHDNQIYSTVCRITDYHRFAVSVVVGTSNKSNSGRYLSSPSNAEEGNLP
jgi:hypothetical protein